MNTDPRYWNVRFVHALQSDGRAPRALELLVIGVLAVTSCEAQERARKLTNLDEKEFQVSEVRSM